MAEGIALMGAQAISERPKTFRCVGIVGGGFQARFPKLRAYRSNRKRPSFLRHFRGGEHKNTAGTQECRDFLVKGEAGEEWQDWGG